MELFVAVEPENSNHPHPIFSSSVFQIGIVHGLQPGCADFTRVPGFELVRKQQHPTETTGFKRGVLFSIFDTVSALQTPTSVLGTALNVTVRSKTTSVSKGSDL